MNSLGACKPSLDNKKTMTDMKRLLALLMLVACLLPLWAQADENPVADAKAMVKAGCARFTVLTPEMIRIQYSSSKQFEDRATFAVVNRRLPVPAYKVKKKGGWLTITTDALTLRYKMGALISADNADALSVELTVNGRQVKWHPGLQDDQNLKGTMRTLDGQNGTNKERDLENGLLSRSGWSIIDESPRTKRGDGSTTFAFDGNVDGIPWVAEPVDKEAVDWYFMGYGHNYRKALGDFTKIAGRQPMPPLYVLGYWYSKYQRYTADEFMQIATDVRQNQIPMDVMIFDMDWHTEGWTGWTWDRSIIPDPEGLIDFMHKKNLKVALNLHPADGVDDDEEFFDDVRNDMGLPADVKRVPWNLSDGKFYHSMFNRILRARERQGVDFWWLDWQQNRTSKFMEGLGETFWCNHVFYNDMRLNRTWQPYFTATASNVCFGYWGHDLGGHVQDGPNDPELYLRWMQFGVFTPIFRTHATNQPHIERRIWKYANFPLLLETVKLRYRLMPYIYTACRQAYDTGVSICRPLYYDWPETNEAYTYKDEYMFGDDILVAPVLQASGADGKTPRTTWLPEGRWFDVCRNQVVEGGRVMQDSYALGETPYFYKAGSVIVCNPPVQNLQVRPDRLVVQVVPGADGQTTLYEDEGDSEAYKQGQFTTTGIEHRGQGISILPREGSFKGMPAERAYTVEFLGCERPAQVSVNGQAVPNGQWNYDAAKRLLTVFIGSTPCSERIDIQAKP